MRFSRLLSTVAFGALMPLDGNAQYAATTRVPLGILVLSVDSAPSPVADSVVAASIVAMRAMKSSERLRALSWQDALRDPPLATDLPKRPTGLAPGDLQELAFQFGAVVVAVRARTLADGKLEVRSTLEIPRPRQSVSWPTLTAETTRDAGEAIAQRAFADSTIKKLGVARLGCPTGVLFEFQVDSQAQLIDPDSAMARAGRRGRGETLLQFVVDSFGRPQPATFKVLNSADRSFAPAVESAVSEWRFVPARQGNCHVAQLVQMPVYGRLP